MYKDLKSHWNLWKTLKYRTNIKIFKTSSEFHTVLSLTMFSENYWYLYRMQFRPKKYWNKWEKLLEIIYDKITIVFLTYSWKYVVDLLIILEYLWISSFETCGNPALDYHMLYGWLSANRSIRFGTFCNRRCFSVYMRHCNHRPKRL